MITLAFFIISFSALQLVVAAVNLLFRQPFRGKKSDFNGLVSVLIPARDEEENILNLIDDLKKQNYNNIEIIVLNDQSTDKTGYLVSEQMKNERRIRLIESIVLPHGWLGKNNACHVLANEAKGEYLLFIDADVRLRDDIIISSVSYAEKHRLALLSIFPEQVMITSGEKMTIPIMNFILLSLLPLILVRHSRRRSLSAANGQFMLFSAKEYHKMRPHEKVKNNQVEDIAIARYFKENHLKIACVTGKRNVKCRMYKSFDEAVNGFSKNVSCFFGNSFILAIIFWVITTFGIIIIPLILRPLFFILYLLVIITTRIIISLISHQNVLSNIIMLIPQQISLGIILHKALWNKHKGTIKWKGRNI